MTYKALYSKQIHLNNYEELNSSTGEGELSQKQMDQGASAPGTVADEDRVNEQLQKVVDETKARNEMRACPSSSDLLYDDYEDMPPLVPLSSDVRPLVPLSSDMYAPVPLSSDTKDDVKRILELLGNDKMPALEIPSSYSDGHYPGYFQEVD
jgi:hypothetical protein